MGEGTSKDSLLAFLQDDQQVSKQDYNRQGLDAHE